MANEAATHKTETTTALKDQPGALVERVLRGETIVLTRYGRPVAILRPLTDDELAAFGPVAA